MARHDAPLRASLRIAGLYLLVCTAWILLSDAVVERLFDPAAAARLQTIKGLAFVALSAALIFWLVLRELRRVREGRQRDGLLMEQELAGVYVIRDGRFLQVNGRLAATFGYEPDAMVADVTVADVLSPEERDDVLERLRARQAGEAASFRYRFTGVRADGSRLRAEVHGGRVVWEGRPAVMGILLDVTEREAMEEQALRAQRLEALGHLTGAVAHDFNNVLTALIAPLELSLHQLEPGHPVRQELVEARATAERAVSFSRQLLSFSRRRVHRPRPVDLAAVVEGMGAMVARLVPSGVRLVREGGDRGLVVEMDPAYLEQVIMNLVVNATEAVAEGEGRRIVLRLGEVERDGTGWAFLEVEDDGPGIEPDTRARLFEPFFTTKSRGTGLGLATVHGVVTQAGGVVEVTSQPGEGARFRVLLPRSRRAASAAEARREGPPSEAPAGGRGETILLVEDEAPVRSVTSRALTRFGYRVLEAPDAATAEELFRSEPAVRLVLSDVGLPDLDGVALAERLRALRPETPVVFTSGHSDTTVMERLASDPSARFLEKPYSVEGLLRCVADALARSGAAEKGGEG